MSKGKGNKGTQSGSGAKIAGKGPSSHPGNGGNWPSTTGNKSGGGRGNGQPKGK